MGMASLNSEYEDTGPRVYQSSDSLLDHQLPSPTVVMHSTYIPYVKYILLLNCLVSFVFYGFNSTLADYLQSTFGFSEGRSGFLVNTFISLNYVFSLIGGIVADELLGK